MRNVLANALAAFLIVAFTAVVVMGYLAAFKFLVLYLVGA